MKMLYAHHRRSSGAGKIDQILADVASGLSITPTQDSEKEMDLLFWNNGT
jgi:hypothetical protein